MEKSSGNHLVQLTFSIQAVSARADCSGLCPVRFWLLNETVILILEVLDCHRKLHVFLQKNKPNQTKPQKRNNTYVKKGFEVFADFSFHI